MEIFNLTLGRKNKRIFQAKLLLPRVKDVRQKKKKEKEKKKKGRERKRTNQPRLKKSKRK